MMDIIQQLRRDEGCVRHAYQDSLGFWTIGIGRLIDERRGGGISDTEADMLLNHDVDRRRADLIDRLPYWRDLNDARQGALVNMAFQMGVAGLMGFRNMLAALERYDYETAAGACLDSLYARQTPNRARRVSEQIRSGRWV